MLGKKLGMTQIFNEHGDLIPVTVLEVGPCTVVQVRTSETDGYWALQLGFEETKAARLNKAKRGHLAKNKAGMLRKLKEFRVEGDTGLKAGDVLRANFFETGD
ncbi:MAG: 50S ribosomal protein L3, partial [Candidatus Margulisbacteria bacterium]|nr:50S ribosomal protein L3 [Candidatus Margulisiibacteriota bacterium]